MRNLKLAYILVTFLLRLSEKQIFGVQHVFHKQANLPTLHLIAKSRVTVVSIPVFSILHYASNIAIMNLQERWVFCVFIRLFFALV